MNDQPFTIKLLDKNNVHEIAAFERALFNAFKSSKDLSLEAIWDFNYPEQRIKTKIHYNDCEIMTVRVGDTIVAGSGINFNMSNKLQLEYYGFSIDKNELFICEGLYLFNTYSNLNNLFFLLAAFRKSLFKYLVSQNIQRVYATCSQRRLRNYRFLGFRDIDMKIFDGNKEYLLMINV